MALAIFFSFKLAAHFSNFEPLRHYCLASLLQCQFHRLCNPAAEVRCVVLTPCTQLDAIHAALNGRVAASWAIALQTLENTLNCWGIRHQGRSLANWLRVRFR